MGRFEDGGEYPKDIVKGAISKVLLNFIFYLGKKLSKVKFLVFLIFFFCKKLSKVRQIRIADFIKEVVATRRWNTDWKTHIYTAHFWSFVLYDDNHHYMTT